MQEACCKGAPLILCPEANNVFRCALLAVDSLSSSMDGKYIPRALFYHLREALNMLLP